MSNGQTVYAVSEGVYSDYRVLALFADKATAEKAIVAHKGHDDSISGDPRVEEFTMYDTVPEPVTVWSISQTLWDDGTEDPPFQRSKTGMPWQHYGNIGHRPSVGYVRAPMHRNKGGRLEVQGSDESGVLKAFSDRRAMIKAGQ